MDSLKHLSGENVKVALIDSGIFTDRREFKNRKIWQNCETDDVGHGTAVASILFSVAKNIELFSYKIFGNEYETEVEDLIELLEKLENEKIDIIHISSGVTFISKENKQRLHDVCKRLSDNDVSIVAAFDNDGRISYPAYFDCVIGVDWNKYCSNGRDYIFFDGSNINIGGTGASMRLPWKDGYKIVAGASFAAPYISGIVAKLKESGIKKNKYILEKLSENSARVVKWRKKEEYNKLPNINRAVTFPFNKEIDAIYRNNDLVDYKLVGAFDYRLLGNVGKKVSEIINNDNCDLIIRDIDELDWKKEEFDTFILGHTDIISSVLNKSLINEFIEKCKKYKKQIVSFDDPNDFITNNTEKNVYTPNITEAEIPVNNMGKLFGINTPVVNVMGTSSKQGKFTLQLKIKREIMGRGFKVGMLGTEPNAEIVGFDECVPMGYNSMEMASRPEIIQVINEKLHYIDEKNVDVIICGSQSQTVSYNYGNMGFYPIQQHNFILATEPDCTVLVANIGDEVEYIKRTIQYIEATASSKVIAIVMSNLISDRNWNVKGTAFRVAEGLIEQDIIDRIEKETKRKCYYMGSENSIHDLVDSIVNYLS
ncbi:MAG: S8 family serine peptidase [Lachnospiraceae bacterium]|nr:S8 family serine peptidase [Lachnospiraceae bacterium]